MDNRTKKHLIEAEILLIFLINISVLFSMYISIQKTVIAGEYFQDIYPSYFVFGYGISYLILIILTLIAIRVNASGSLARINTIKKIEKISMGLLLFNFLIIISIVCMYLLIQFGIIFWQPYFLELLLLSLLTVTGIIGFILVILNIILNYQIKRSYS